MPIYEYGCLKCGDRSEALQGVHAAPLTTCSICGGGLKKLPSAPAFQFKGTGWYVTDYAKKDKGKDAGKDSSSSEGSSGSSDSSSSATSDGSSGGSSSSSEGKSDSKKESSSSASSSTEK